MARRLSGSGAAQRPIHVNDTAQVRAQNQGTFANAIVVSDRRLGWELPVLCWFCAKAARGTCRFCGRGVCEDHARFGPYLLEVHRSTARNRTEGLVVEDALHCGTCRPRPQPVPMPELD